VDPAYILQYRPPTPAEEETPQESEARAYRQHKLAVEANSYMNGCFSISVARAGQAPGAATSLIGGSAIVHPDGRTLAQARGVGDELIVARIDLGDCKPVKKTMFNFTKRRKIAITGIIEQQKAGVNEPEFL
jgi:predicted amidohydrolase